MIRLFCLIDSGYINRNQGFWGAGYICGRQEDLIGVPKTASDDEAVIGLLLLS